MMASIVLRPGRKPNCLFVFQISLVLLMMWRAMMRSKTLLRADVMAIGR